MLDEFMEVSDMESLFSNYPSEPINSEETDQPPIHVLLKNGVPLNPINEKLRNNAVEV